MGLEYFYHNPKEETIISKNKWYFGDIYKQNKRRCFSKDKCITSIANKPKENQNTSNFLLTRCNTSDEDPLNTSCTSCSSNEDPKRPDTLIKMRSKEFNTDDKSKHLRKTYYHKLIKSQLINSKETIKNNTIFIFDWDDTLFFTSHLNPSKNTTFFYESKKEEKLMNTIEYYISEILNKALSKGNVLIITNSSEGWVQTCAKFFYPNLLPILDKISIISSRELYQNKFPNDPITWKIKTFNDLKEKFNFNKCIVSNIICIGDDNSEIIAAKKLGENFNNCLVKTIKFREKPDLTDLIKQMILINEQILRVYNYPKSLTIQVDKKKNPNK